MNYVQLPEFSWDFIEKHYPNYQSCQSIADSDDLQKIVDDECTCSGHDDDASMTLMLEIAENLGLNPSKVKADVLVDGKNHPAVKLEAQKQLSELEMHLYHRALNSYIHDLKDPICVSLVYYHPNDDETKRVYDFEEMANDFEDQLSKLDENVVVMCSAEPSAEAPAQATYFLLGHGAVKHFESLSSEQREKMPNADLERLQYLGYDILKIDGTTDPLTILTKTSGWMDFIQLTETTYKILKAHDIPPVAEETKTLTISASSEVNTKVVLDASKFHALYRSCLAKTEQFNRNHGTFDIPPTKEAYLENLIGGEIDSDAEQDFYDDYIEAVNEANPMPNQSVDYSIVFE